MVRSMFVRPRPRAAALRRRAGRTAAAVLTRKSGGISLRKSIKARARTATRTMLRRRNPLKRMLPSAPRGGLPSFSSFKLANPPNKVIQTMKDVSAPSYYVTNEAYQIKVDDGYQTPSDSSFNNLADIKYILSKVPLSATSAINQCLLESAAGEYMMSNSSLATLYIDIYDIVRVRDAQTPSETGGPTNAWTNGVYQEGGAPTGFAYINSLPTDSRLFKEYFKVMKRSHIGLQPGATHRHSVILKPNKLLDSATYNTQTGDSAGLTVYTMICAWGQPVSTVEEGGAPPTVSTASGVVNVVKSVRYKYSWVSKNTNEWFGVDNLQTLGTEKVVTDAAIIDNDEV